MAAKKQALYVVNHFGRDHFIWASSAEEARAEAEKPVPTTFIADISSPGASNATAPFTGGIETARATKRASSRS
jgi:hypothetical protein